MIVLDGTVGITTPTEQAATTIGVGNATPSASGAGITFPATQSASTDANTLDDYEEGTWTPTVRGTSTAGTGTYTVQVGTYTKIGRLVTVTVACVWSATTATGKVVIGILPFTPANINANVEYVCPVEFSNMTMPASTVPMGIAPNNNALVLLYGQTVGTGAVAQLDMDTAAAVYFSLTYQTT
jgi:hypothetical protein